MIAIPFTGLNTLCQRVTLIFVGLFLTGCQSLPAPQMPEPASWASQRQTLLDIDHWSLSGRLNVRHNTRSDTININWLQTGNDFEIHMSGSLGMGAVAVHGDINRVVMEKAGDEPVVLEDMDALGRQYLDFDFPASHLKFWVRGLPVPDLAMQATWNDLAQLSTLTQTDAQGQRWNLTFDRYQNRNDLPMPGRIRLEQHDIRLTFLISDWQIRPALLARL